VQTVFEIMSSVIALTAVAGLVKIDPVAFAVVAVLFVLSDGGKFGNEVASKEYEMSSMGRCDFQTLCVGVDGRFVSVRLLSSFRK
jgi:hypothetical protein